MAGALVCAVLCSALSPSAAIAERQVPASSMEVAFDELSHGQEAAAVARLEEARGTASADPAQLINLGTAYARQGRVDDAAAAYRAAIASDTRYRLELADGSWLDSRDAARLALSQLDKRPAFAMR